MTNEMMKTPMSSLGAFGQAAIVRARAVMATVAAIIACRGLPGAATNTRESGN